MAAQFTSKPKIVNSNSNLLPFAPFSLFQAVGNQVEEGACRLHMVPRVPIINALLTNIRDVYL
ncbi:unnamed protein product [Prunus armeniaca]|uniref:Uncharacterized protein n=1 Tax=Prunus armeniaca TaxID=36596 RepID=A0A6J5W5Z6_PRUAR|nr:unnamed protein product [Prunus armeniaca]CAB4295327.1 unnamed protein product [Prunus armeniaca]